MANCLGDILAAVPKPGADAAADRWAADSPNRQRQIVEMLSRANEEDLPADVRRRFNKIRARHGEPQTPEQADALRFQLDQEIAAYWAAVRPGEDTKGY